MSTDVPFVRNESKADWAAIRGEASIYLIFASTMVFAWVAWQDIQLRHTQIATNQRLIQRMDTDALITERALAALEGRKPSLKSQQYQLRTEDSGPRLVAPE
jgi:hypothetical protein